MASVLRFLLAVACLPLCAALPRVLWLIVFSATGVFADTGIPAGGYWMLGGFLSFFAVSLCLPAPVRVYVLGHELTHAVWALLFGARVSGLKVGLRGGEVTVSKSNVWITLAPYFFPFYTFVVLLISVLVRMLVKPFPCPNAWLFAIGFTWCFHAIFTVRALSQEQPDVDEYGRIFSWAFIWIANMAGLFLGLIAVTPLTFRQAGRLAWVTASSFYAAIGHWMTILVDIIRQALA